MALNLSTLTSPATSGDVLAEALTTADFLEPVPVLRNLARGSNKGGDAEQAVALNQPKALPLDANGKGYLYLPVTTGNAPAVTFPTIGGSDDFVLEMDVYIVETNGCYLVTGATSAHRFFLTDSLFLFSGGRSAALSSPVSEGFSTIRIERTSGSISLYQNGVLKSTPTAAPDAYSFTHLSFNGQFSSGIPPLNGYIQKVTLSINGTEELNIDFTSTNVRHGATKFACATGQVVTINQDSSSSNDVATVIKKPVLRFDGVNDFMDGLLNQTVTGGYMFAAFSVLGDGGSEGYGRILGLNSTGSVDSGAGGVAFRRNATTTGLMIRYNENNITTHSDFFDDERGDYLLEAKVLTGSQKSKINNADLVTGSVTGQLSAEEFQIAALTNGAGNRAAIDLEYLALFPSSITDAQADAVRNYINNRNNVFDLKDGFGYYFYDAQKAPVGNISSGSASWNGRIVGSDNGDTDKYATQVVSNDQPVSDGYVVTFADNSDHLDIPSTTQAGWQVVGTSLGTFAYKVNSNAVTELNLLGNAGAIRTVGDSYGMILLPESATGKDIEDARKLLIDRGAADGTTGSSLQSFWQSRSDIVEFKSINTTGISNMSYAWFGNGYLIAFPLIDMSGVTNIRNAFSFNNSLLSFPAIQAPNCVNFTETWRYTVSLTSFPADAKLGTSTNGATFYGAWQASGLTSFSTPLPTANNAYAAWSSCISLESFSAELPSVNNAREAWYNCSSLESFSTELPSLTNAMFAWDGCSSLTSFDVPLPSVNAMYRAWAGCSSLTDFSEEVFANWNPSSISSGVFDFAWLGCSSLTSQSVENILVPIDSSGKYATSTGASGGTALADAGIDIDYNGDTLSAATTAAIDSLSGKGWQVYINGELVIPNILDLQPAAAYSLRSFDAEADPNVVNVRRSSDGATSDFTASEVSNGTLVAFVGAGNDGHVTTWYDQGGTNHATQTVASSQPKIVDAGTLVTEGGLAALDFDGTSDQHIVMSHSDLYGQSRLDSFYVTSTSDNTYLYPARTTSGSYHGLVADDGAVFSYIAGSNYGTVNAYANNTLFTGTTRDEYHAATVGYKLISHENAQTVDWDSFNFGRYGTAVSTYNYTGKLQEMIFFNTDQSTNRTGIENNINDHFDIYS